MLQRHLQALRDGIVAAGAQVKISIDDSVKELDDLLSEPIQGLSRTERVEEFEGESMLELANKLGTSLT